MCNTTTLEFHPIRHIVGEWSRHRAKKELMEKGFTLTGGNCKPLTEEEADGYFKRAGTAVGDEVVFRIGQESGAFGDGTILQNIIAWIKQTLQYLKDNPDVLVKIITAILSILMLFAL